MDDTISFREMLDKVRAGDEVAAVGLLRRYEPEVRRAVRVRLTDPNLRRVVDSADICQSVFGAFFVRVVAGQFDLVEPAQLVKLLVRMARNKVIDHAKRPSNRDTRTPESGVLEKAMGPGGTPSEVVAAAELLAEARRRLTAGEQKIAEQRADGMSWQEIGAANGTTPDAARKALERALDRVCAELQIS